MNLFWQAVSEDTWKLTLEHSLPIIIFSSTVVRRHITLGALWAKQEIWKSTSSFTLEKNPSTAQNAGSQVLNPWRQYWRLSDLKWPPDKGRVEVVDGDLCVLVAQQDGLFCHQPAPSCKLIASHQLERPAPSCFHPHQGLLLPSTFLQLSHPGLDWLSIMVSPLL